jgi:hypothetical protein
VTTTVQEAARRGPQPHRDTVDERGGRPIEGVPPAMANVFRAGERVMRLSNGATAVFLSVWQFALSDLAGNSWERAFAQWIARHDTQILGLGMVGFGLDEIDWDPVQFPSQKAFLVRALDTALTRHRWAELCYDPPHAEENLRNCRQLVEPFERPAESSRADVPWPGQDDHQTFCPEHLVHCSDYGWCRVCVDCGTDHPQDPETAPGGRGRTDIRPPPS